MISDRAMALHLAVQVALESHNHHKPDLISLYREFRDLLEEPGRTVKIDLIVGPVMEQTTGQFTLHIQQEGPDMQITDTQKFSYTLNTSDSKGAKTTETAEWTVLPDDGTVATIAVSEDTQSLEVVAVGTGTLQGTVTLPNLDPPLSASFVVDVVAGGTTTINLEAGEVTEQ